MAAAEGEAPHARASRPALPPARTAPVLVAALTGAALTAATALALIACTVPCAGCARKTDVKPPQLGSTRQAWMRIF